MKRVILIVLDSVGCGEAPDAAAYGDAGSNTLRAASTSRYFHMPNMKRLGYFNIDGVELDHDEPEENPIGAYAKLQELSKGKDTTTGHWEMAGVVSENPMPTFPDGFPQEVLDEFEKQTGRHAIVNKPYSGTQVIADYGEEHLKTGDLIVYTSADSVFQIAANEAIVPVEELYHYCEIARKILQGPYGVGRVIARPFFTEEIPMVEVNGEDGSVKKVPAEVPMAIIDGKPVKFTRTSRRHDFSLEPTGRTMLDVLKDDGYAVNAVGKIVDIFAGRGVTDFVRTSGNPDGIEKTIDWMKKDFHGLLFTNLVDTDMIYGHRNDVDGYAKALTYFDEQLPRIIEQMKDDDILMITADHGCDPSTPSTDHSREYVPLVMYGNKIVAGKNYGIIQGFDVISDTILSYLDSAEKLGDKQLF